MIHCSPPGWTPDPGWLGRSLRAGHQTSGFTTCGSVRSLVMGRRGLVPSQTATTTEKWSYSGLFLMQFRIFVIEVRWRVFRSFRTLSDTMEGGDEALCVQATSLFTAEHLSVAGGVEE